MGLFKKKEEIPKIPKTRTLPELPELAPLKEDIRKDLPELPTFPTSSKNETMNQEMVKSAVSELPSPGEEEEEEMPEIPASLEAPAEGPILPQKPQELNSIPELPKMPAKIETPEVAPVVEAPVVPTHLPKTKKVERPKTDDPIFVRIDRFQSAQKNLEEIKSKVEEIEEVLEKIKKVKSKEDDELKGWEEDVQKLKMRLAQVDDDIFSQL